MDTRKRVGLGVLVVAVGAIAGIVTRATGRRTDEAPPADRLSAPAGPAASGENGPTRRSPRQPPVLVSHAYSLPISPTSPDYDPIKLGLAMGSRNLFNQEPRDARWAPAMERLMTPLVQQDLALIPGVSHVTTECRTTGCRVTYTASDKKQKSAARLVLRDLWGGGVSGMVDGEFTTFYRGDRFKGIDPADPAALLERLKHRRVEQLAKARRLHQRGWPRYKTVPPEYWPEK